MRQTEAGVRAPLTSADAGPTDSATLRLVRMFADDLMLLWKQLEKGSVDYGSGLRRSKYIDGFGPSAVVTSGDKVLAIRFSDVEFLARAGTSSKAISELREALSKITGPLGSPTAPRVAQAYLEGIAHAIISTAPSRTRQQALMLEIAIEIDQAAKAEMPDLRFSFPVTGFDLPDENLVSLSSGHFLRRLSSAERLELSAPGSFPIGYVGGVPDPVVSYTAWALEGSCSHEIVRTGLLQFGWSSIDEEEILAEITSLRIASDVTIGLQAGAVLLLPWRVRLSHHRFPALELPVDSELAVQRMCGSSEAESVRLAKEILATGWLHRPGAVRNAVRPFNKVFSSPTRVDRVVNSVYGLEALLLHGIYRGGGKTLTRRAEALLGSSSFDRREIAGLVNDAYQERVATTHPRESRIAVNDRMVLELLRNSFRSILCQSDPYSVRRFLAQVNAELTQTHRISLDEYLGLPEPSPKAEPRYRHSSYRLFRTGFYAAQKAELIEGESCHSLTAE